MDVTVGENFIVRVKKDKKELIISAIPTLPKFELPKMSDYTIELMKIPLTLIQNTYILKNPDYILQPNRGVLIELKRGDIQNKQFPYIYVTEKTYLFQMESKVDLKNSNTEWISDNTYVYSTQPFKLLRKDVDMKKPFDDTGDFHSFKIDMITLCWAEKTDLTKYKYAGIMKEINQDGKQYVLPKSVPYDIIKYSISKIVLEKPTAEFMKKIFLKKKAEEIFEYDPDTTVFFKNESSLMSKLRKITRHERVYSKEADKVFRKRCNKSQTEYIKKN
jgi:hypothetical protein